MRRTPVGFALTDGAADLWSRIWGLLKYLARLPIIRFFTVHSAAVAEYCRVKAQELYGAHRVYGYVYGGSGGGYKTMSCIENTTAFDGAVPYVIGSPMSLPNCLTVQAHGIRVLRNCWERITDAVEPGGSGDIYAGLTQDESEALKEILSMGFPVRMCASLGERDDGSLPVLSPVVHQMDPSYFTDFWEKPGYLGSDPGGTAVRDRICMRTHVVTAGIPKLERFAKNPEGRNGTDDAWQKMLADGSGAFIEVEEVPQGDNLYLDGVDIIIEGGNACGKKLRLKSIDGKRLIPGMSYGVDSIRL